MSILIDRGAGDVVELAMAPADSHWARDDLVCSKPGELMVYLGHPAREPRRPPTPEGAQALAVVRVPAACRQIFDALITPVTEPSAEI